MKTIAVIHGPNLNLLGTREPEVYGIKKFEEINEEIENKADDIGIQVNIFQSNHEGEIIDYIQEGCREWDGIVINPAALTHYSVALRDVLISSQLPIIEVHLSNIYKREEFRHKSMIAPIAVGQISGLGYEGYLFALEGIMTTIQKGSY